MRHTIFGLIAAIAVATASAAPALACAGGQFASPCAPIYVPMHDYSGCDSGCGGWAHARLPDPALQYHSAPVRHQYYYVNQGPTYAGPGAFAPYPTYEEGAVAGWEGDRHRTRYGDREYPLRRYY
jgi:hypothetical protein